MPNLPYARAGQPTERIPVSVEFLLTTPVVVVTPGPGVLSALDVRLALTTR